MCLGHLGEQACSAVLTRLRTLGHGLDQGVVQHGDDIFDSHALPVHAVHTQLDEKVAHPHDEQPARRQKHVGHLQRSTLFVG